VLLERQVADYDRVLLEDVDRARDRIRESRRSIGHSRGRVPVRHLTPATAIAIGRLGAAVGPLAAGQAHLLEQGHRRIPLGMGRSPASAIQTTWGLRHVM
jgi:hypothetical protein